MNENELLDLMTTPSPRLVEDVRKIDGDILVLGCGGKVGPSLAITAKRAIDQAGLNKKVIGVSLFDYPEAPQTMRNAGVEVIEADLFNSDQLSALLDVKNIIYMVGRKFGTYQNQSLTWAINVLLPAKVCERFPHANVVAFSTGNVYSYANISSGGAREDDLPVPVGEYGQTCLGRERVLEHYAGLNGNPMLMFRLNYAIDMRYGVLFDLAKNIIAGTPINLEIGYFNCIWQGDVCEYAIRSLLHTSNPPCILNVTGPESISIRWAADTMGKLLGKEPVFVGDPNPQKALFSNTTKMTSLMGYPTMPLNKMMAMVADWVSSGGKFINAPTHFESTDGNY
jgi:nucleoside-diphosphate-sugar epimerase